MDIHYFILNLLASPTWLAAIALFLLGYSWTTKTDNVDKVMAAHVNDLQTEKLDRDGAIAGTGSFSWISAFPNMTVTAKTDDYAVLAADFGIHQSLSMSAAGLKTFTLPSVAAGDIGKIITFIKLGAGQVTIAAADADTIHDSSAGGTIYNAQAGETYATITLMLISATQWAITGVSGIGWITT